MDKEPYKNNEHVKFVFYNGESPVLCDHVKYIV